MKIRLMIRTPCGSIQFANEGKWTEDNLITGEVIAAAQTSNDPDNENAINDPHALRFNSVRKRGEMNWG